MVAVVENGLEVGSEAHRLTYLGGHDTGAIMRDHPFMDPMDVYMRKLGKVEGPVQTGRMEWGLRMEDTIIEKFAEDHGEVEPGGFVRHNTMTWFGGTADGTIKGTREGVDAKNIGFFNEKWGPEGTDQVPKYILWQAHHYMTLTGYRRWWIAVLAGGQTYREYVVDRNEQLAEHICITLKDFWKNIQGEIPPEIDGSDAAREFLYLSYPQDNNESRPTDENEEALMKIISDCGREMREAEGRRKEAQNLLKAKMGATRRLDAPNGYALWSTRKGAHFLDGPSVKREHPELYEKFTRQRRNSRTLSVHLKDKKEEANE